MDDSDNLRLDFAHNVTHSGASNNSYDYSSHYNIQGFSFGIVALQGNTDHNDSEVWVRIYNKQDNDPAGTDTATHQLALHTLQTQLSIVRIDWYDASTGITTTLSLASLQSDGLGGYLVTGLGFNDRVTVFGPEAGFNAIEIENPISGAHGLTDLIIGGSLQDGTLNGDAFDIGAFQYVEIETLVNVPTLNLKHNLLITDRDGDTATGTLNLALNAPPVIPPVVLDLNGDGLRFLAHDDPANQAQFDFNGDGKLERTSWVDPHDGLLVLDANADQKVNGPSEFVFANGSAGAYTDMAALRMLHDTNHDGVLDASDASFGLFGVWRDANANGISETGEFRSLTEVGISSINLNSDGHTYLAANGEVLVHGQSLYTQADGSQGIAGDVALTSFAIPTAPALADVLSPSNATFDGLLQQAAQQFMNNPPVMGPIQANTQLQDSQPLLGAIPDAPEVTVASASSAPAVDSTPVAPLEPFSATVAANAPAPVQVPDSVAVVQDAPPAIG
jgi:hypothetical protein